MGILDSNKVIASSQVKKVNLSGVSLSSVNYIGSSIDVSGYNLLIISATFSGSGQHDIWVRGNQDDAAYKAQMTVVDASTMGNISSITANGIYYVDVSLVNYVQLYNNASLEETLSAYLTCKRNYETPKATKTPSGNFTLDLGDTGNVGTINTKGYNLLVIDYTTTDTERNTLVNLLADSYYGVVLLPIFDNSGFYSNGALTFSGHYLVDVSQVDLLYVRKNKGASGATGTLNWSLFENYIENVGTLKPLQLLGTYELSGGYKAGLSIPNQFKYFYMEGCYLSGTTLTSADISVSMLSVPQFIGVGPVNGVSTVIFEGERIRVFKTDWIENTYFNNFTLVAGIENGVSGGKLYVNIYGVR